MEFQGVTHQTRGRGHSEVGGGRVDATHSAVACDLCQQRTQTALRMYYGMVGRANSTSTHTRISVPMYADWQFQNSLRKSFLPPHHILLSSWILSVVVHRPLSCSDTVPRLHTAYKLDSASCVSAQLSINVASYLILGRYIHLLHFTNKNSEVLTWLIFILDGNHARSIRPSSKPSPYRLRRRAQYSA